MSGMYLPEATMFSILIGIVFVLVLSLIYCMFKHTAVCCKPEVIRHIEFMTKVNDEAIVSVDDQVRDLKKDFERKSHNLQLMFTRIKRIERHIEETNGVKEFSGVQNIYI